MTSDNNIKKIDKNLVLSFKKFACTGDRDEKKYSRCTTRFNELPCLGGGMDTDIRNGRPRQNHQLVCGHDQHRA